MSARNLVAVWLAALLVFSIAPGIDLWVSGLFFDDHTGLFPLANSGGLEVIRDLIWTAANLLVLAALIFGLQALLATRPTAVPGRFWGFVLLLAAIGPGVIVNSLLKAYWGRARPADTDVFGGTHPFTPAWEFAGNCPGNCSFVSGEAAGVAVLAIVVGVALWRSVPDRRALFWTLVVLVVIGAGLRVLKGRHYLSDVVWSLILMVSLARALWLWLGLPDMAHRITAAAFVTDARRLTGNVRRALRWP